MDEANKTLVVEVRKVEGGYEVSYEAPPEVTFTEALRRGFELTGSTVHVRIDATAIVANPKAKNWVIHHEDHARASPEKVLPLVQDVLEKWLRGLGYSVEFRSS